MRKNYLNRLDRMDWLIKKKATGTPNEFARQLGISKSSLYEYLAVLMDRGAPILYCKKRLTYYYEKEGGFSFCFCLKKD